MNAAQLRVIDFKPGMRVRVIDTEHQYAGRTGTLEFSQAGAAWVRIGSADVPVSVNKLAVVPQMGVAK